MTINDGQRDGWSKGRQDESMRASAPKKTEREKAQWLSDAEREKEFITCLKHLNKQNKESELGVLVVHTALRITEQRQVIHQQRHE